MQHHYLSILVKYSMKNSDCWFDQVSAEHSKMDWVVVNFQVYVFVEVLEKSSEYWVWDNRLDQVFVESYSPLKHWVWNNWRDQEVLVETSLCFHEA